MIHLRHLSQGFDLANGTKHTSKERHCVVFNNDTVLLNLNKNTRFETIVNEHGNVCNIFRHLNNRY